MLAVSPALPLRLTRLCPPPVRLEVLRHQPVAHGPALDVAVLRAHGHRAHVQVPPQPRPRPRPSPVPRRFHFLSVLKPHFLLSIILNDFWFFVFFKMYVLFKMEFCVWFISLLILPCFIARGFYFYLHPPGKGTYRECKILFTKMDRPRTRAQPLAYFKLSCFLAPSPCPRKSTLTVSHSLARFRSLCTTRCSPGAAADGPTDGEGLSSISPSPRRGPQPPPHASAEPA